MSQPRILSGIKPSGSLNIGGYIGALKNWIDLQYDYETYFCIVDLHAITVEQDPTQLYEQTLELAKIYIAAGIDPQHSKIFIQSHVPQHAQLAWILNCFTYMGELEKMTQFKDKSAGNQQRASAGLFDYPVLMAADILLYQTDLVPVGEDQTQHIELTRDLAKRINNRFKKDLFNIPKGFIPKTGARIKGLQDPTKKMSKSGINNNDVIFLLDDAKTISKKINKAVTDTDGKVIFDELKKPGISNLLTILSALTGTSIKQLEKDFAQAQYGEFKKAVAEKIINTLEPIQEKYHHIKQKDLLEMLHAHAQIAQKTAQNTLNNLHQSIGFIG